MKYERFNISETDLKEGMIVKRKSQTNQALWSICEA